MLRRPELLSRKQLAWTGALALFMMALSPGETQNAVANGDTRTLYLYHTHTRESIQATFKVNGQYDQATLDKLNWFLRDWRRDEPTKMDPRLFDVVWETYRESGSQEPIQIVSAYRSPETNAMLRRRSKAVAEFSQHMLGKAMDMHYVDVPMSRVREIGMKLQRGGVGYYPTAGTPFVHLDVGNVRAWPRMTYDQLARLFPDGKTVHLPPNGQPLARYEEARAEIESRGGVSAPPTAEPKSKGFFATLFGGGNDEDEADAAPPTVVSTPRDGPRSHVTTYLASRNQQQAAPTQVASAQTSSPDENNGLSGFFQADAARRSASVERAEGNLPRGETYLSPADPAPMPPSRGDRNRPQAPPAAPSSSLDGKQTDASRQAALPASVAAPVHAPVPLPPRRPSELLPTFVANMSAPLPPTRPTDLRVAEPRGETTRVARAGTLPSVITSGTPATTPMTSPVTALLAFAPAESAADPAAAAAARSASRALSGPIPGLRPTIPPLRPDLVAARLDRGNFGALTAPAPLARSASAPHAAPAQAARADLSGMIFAQPADVAIRFGGASSDLTATGFSGPAVRALPRLEQTASANVPASRLN
jgi:uncharacterized protein YcbK (DUF882 family)